MSTVITSLNSRTAPATATGDGVPNTVEIAENTDPNDADDFVDTDQDGTPNFTDTDSDNDGVPDTGTKPPPVIPMLT